MLTLRSLPELTHLTLTNYPRSLDQETLDFAFPAGLISLLEGHRDTLLEQIRIVVPWYKWDLEGAWDQDGSWSRMKRVIFDDTGKPRKRFSRLNLFKVKIDVRHHGRKKWKDLFQTQAPVALKKAKEMFDLENSGISGGISFNIF